MASYKMTMTERFFDAAKDYTVSAAAGAVPVYFATILGTGVAGNVRDIAAMVGIPDGLGVVFAGVAGVGAFGVAGVAEALTAKAFRVGELMNRYGSFSSNTFKPAGLLAGVALGVAAVALPPFFAEDDCDAPSHIAGSVPTAVPSF